jgi:hypothetical protein
MKRLIIFLLSMPFSLFSAGQKVMRAQVAIVDKLKQDYLINLFLSDSTTVVLNGSGNIIDLTTSRKNTSLKVEEVLNAGGERVITSIGKWKVKYYGQLWPLEGRKIKSIGNLRFDYFLPGWGVNTGKMKSAGNINFDYYREGWGLLEGKLHAINKITFSYFSTGWGVQTGHIESFEGKEKSISVRVLNGVNS